ncbi:MAG: DUF5615 family PIN-like protein [Bacteroidia bacterium]
MKILLDENIDIRFKYQFDINQHEVFTVRDMNWLGIKNGELLQLLQFHQFDVLIAVDKNIPYQRNNTTLPVLIIILNVKRNVLARITKFYPLIIETISKPISRQIIVLDEF